MTLLATIVIAGAITFGLRLSFILLWGRVAVPIWFQRALRYVPPAVLTAIIVPELATWQDRLDLSPANPQLAAGLAAALVAWRTRSIPLTLAVGMAVLLGLRLVTG
ncbi:MAG: Branched-chain amino acid transport protein (AzlD) [Chloroflexi bacterium ADurb.Bin325]|nr:MAG: Branched-chain amino acid transport protein (AzlD) [Chloroflexi bacterium ADurb.Bin325]